MFATAYPLRTRNGRSFVRPRLTAPEPQTDNPDYFFSSERVLPRSSDPGSLSRYSISIRSESIA